MLTIPWAFCEKADKSPGYVEIVGWVERSETHLNPTKLMRCNDGFRQGSTHPTALA